MAETTILRRIIEENSHNGALTLKAAAFAAHGIGNEAIRVLFEEYLGRDGALSMTTARVEDLAEGVRVVGVGRAEPFLAVDMTVDFIVRAQQFRVAMVAVTQAGWSLARSFPSLKDSIAETITLRGQSELRFNSHELDGARPQGLFFRGSIGLDGPLEDLAQLFPSRSELEVAARITMEDGLPKLNLVARGDIAVDLFYFRGLSFELALRSELVRPQPRRSGETPSPHLQVGVALSTRLRIGTDDPVYLRLAARWNPSTRRLALSADVNELVRVGLLHIQNLLRGLDLAKQLPIPLEDAIALTDVTINVDFEPSRPKLMSVGVGMRTTKVWEVVPGLVEVRSIGFYATVFEPLTSPAANLELLGVVRLGQHADLELSASMPAWSARGRLRDNAAINLAEMARHFRLDWPGMPEARIEVLDFGVELQRGVVFGEAFLAIDERMALGLFDLHLQAISLAVNRDERGAISGHIRGLLGLAESTFTIGGDYSNETGFRLKGQQDVDKPLSLRKLLEKLPPDLRVELPPAFPDIQLIGLDIEFQTKGKKFTFKAATHVTGGALESVRVEAVRGAIEFVVENGQVSGRLEGVVAIEPPIGKLQAVFEFRSAEDWTLRLTYPESNALSGGRLALSSLVRVMRNYFELGPGFSIPAALDSGLYQGKLTLESKPQLTLDLEGRFQVLGADFRLLPSRVSRAGISLKIAQLVGDQPIHVNGIINGLASLLGIEELPQSVPQVRVKITEFSVNSHPLQVVFDAQTVVTPGANAISLARVTGQARIHYKDGSLQEDSAIAGTLTVLETQVSLRLRLQAAELRIAIAANNESLHLSRIVGLLDEGMRPGEGYLRRIPPELDGGIESITIMVGLRPFRFDFKGRFAAFESRFEVTTKYQLEAGLTFAFKQTGEAVVLNSLVNALGRVIDGEFELPAVLPKVEVKLEEFSVQTKAKSLVLNASAEGTWDGLPGLTIESFSGSVRLNVKNGALEGDEQNRIGGTMRIAGIDFSAGLSFTRLELSATVESNSRDLRINELLRVVTVDERFRLPEAIDLGLQGAKLLLGLRTGTLLLQAAISSRGENPTGYGFVALTREGGVPNLAFVSGLGLDGALRLSNIPFIGQHLGNLDILKIEQILLLTSTRDLTDYELPKMTALAADRRKVSVKRGVSFLATVGAGELSFPLTMAIYSPRSNELTAADEPEDPPPPTGKIRWVKLDKKLSVLRLNRLGIQFDDGRIRLLMDGGVRAQRLQLDLYGLWLSFKPTGNISEIKPEFGLNGFYFGFNAGPLDVGGGLLKTEDPRYPWYYSGEVRIMVGSYGLAAMGSYAQDQRGIPSLFAYGYLGLPFGKPEFYVKGLAVGFGFNRRVVTPQIDKVRSWALVEAAYGRTGDTDNRLVELNEGFPVAYGNVWMAAGIRFSSMEILDAFALAVLSGGADFEVTLLGMGTAELPPNAGQQALGRIQLAIQASVSLTQGRVYFAGAFTDGSYILVKEARLEGGVAFCTWLWGPHAGQSILTIGGYHPDLDVPSYYPRMPRLGFSLKLENGLVTIKGNSYLAVTPACLMLGGVFEAAFKYQGFEAAVRVRVDSIIAWMPFAYAADGEATISLSYQLGRKWTVNGKATVSISGPEFSGIVEVELWIVSFKYSFGTHRSTQDGISWEEFRKALLAPPKRPPRESQVMTRSPALTVRDVPTQGSRGYWRSWMTRGLLREQRDSSDEIVGWVVDPANAEIRVSTRIPIKTLSHNCKPVLRKPKEDTDGRWSDDFGVGMVVVDPKQFSSDVQITVSEWSSNQMTDGFALVVPKEIGSSPAAMWRPDRARLSNAAGAQAVVPRTLTELSLVTEAKSVGDLEPISRENLARHGREPIRPRAPAPRPPQEPVHSDDPMRKMEQTIVDPGEDRKRLLRLLAESGLPVRQIVEVDAHGAGAHGLVAPPVLVTW